MRSADATRVDTQGKLLGSAVLGRPVHEAQPAKKKRPGIRPKIKPRYFTREDGALVVDIDLRIKSPNKGHFNRLHQGGEVKRVRKKVMKALAAIEKPLLIRSLLMIRYAPSKGLDPKDNLPMAFKPVQDQAVCWLEGNNTLDAKADDGVACPYKLAHDQYQHPVYGVRLVFK